MQQHYKPRPTDVLLITKPKSGTTWLKALIFSIMNRTQFDYQNHPLLTTSPHECVPFLEFYPFKTKNPNSNDPELLPSPRLFAIHTPKTLLPDSIISSGCRIVYVCRDPKDLFVSWWHFKNKLLAKEEPPVSLEVAFDLFCKGTSSVGPFWDHVLGYWKASLDWPNRVLFSKYEDIKREPLIYLKRLAEFLDRPFSLEEEENGVVQEILKLCSFEKMCNLEVNKTGTFEMGVKNNLLFRQGKVGDWENHLTAEMVVRLNQITEQKLSGSGLTF